MVMTVDIGNTNVTFGVFCGDELVFVSRIATDDRKTEDQYAVEFRNILLLNDISPGKTEGCIISSVVPKLSGVMKKAVRLLGIRTVLTVSSGVKTGVNIRTDNPRQTGADIVCGAVWAKESGHVPAVLVDMGTATTFAAVDGKGNLTGYAIMPGVEISLHALREHAAQLPAVSIESPGGAVCGKNTVDAMVSGIVYGAAAAVDGMVRRFQAELGTAEVIITGGLGKKIAPYLETAFVLEEHAILKGLHMLWCKNRM
jgi:type III pantothenate kinase